MKETYLAKKKWTHIGVYAFLLLIVVSVMIALRQIPKRAHAALASQTEMTKGDTLRAAVVYGPNSYRVIEGADGRDSITGINYFLLREFQDSLGAKIILNPVINRDDALAKLNNGDFDILASLPADNFLKDNFLTSDPVCLDRLVLIQMKKAGKTPATSALDLAKDTVHVEKGSAATRRLENLRKEIGDTIYVAEEEGLSEEYLAIKVANGTWKYAVVNEKTAEEMQARYPDLDYSTPVSFTQFQVWVLPQGRDSLLKKVNDFIARRQP